MSSLKVAGPKVAAAGFYLGMQDTEASTQLRSRTNFSDSPLSKWKSRTRSRREPPIRQHSSPVSWYSILERDFFTDSLSLSGRVTRREYVRLTSESEITLRKFSGNLSDRDVSHVSQLSEKDTRRTRWRRVTSALIRIVRNNENNFFGISPSEKVELLLYRTIKRHPTVKSRF